MQQSVILNLDVIGSYKTTDYIFKQDNQDSPVISFKLIKDYYIYDLKDFNSIAFTIVEENTLLKVHEATYEEKDIKKTKDGNFLDFIIPLSVSSEIKSYIIETTSTIAGKSNIIPTFKIFIYEKETSENKYVREVVQNYNRAFAKYIDSIKRSEINSPNGVVGLDKDGIVNKYNLPTRLTEHPTQVIYDSSPHNFRLNERFFLEYYDRDSEQWEVADRLNGGEFTTERKDLVFDGGIFTQ